MGSKADANNIETSATNLVANDPKRRFWDSKKDDRFSSPGERNEKRRLRVIRLLVS